MILAGRRINDGMGGFVAQKTAKLLIHSGVNPRGARVGVLGLTFKENVPDTRNTKTVDIVEELREYNVEALVHDPLADPEAARAEYGLELAADEALTGLDAGVLAVAHDCYRERGAEWIKNLLGGRGVVIDVKGLLDPAAFTGDYLYWRR